MNINLENENLSQLEKQAITNLLNNQNKDINDDLEQMWYLMDKVWDDMELNNKILDWEKIGKYYSHPVWILNGLFIQNHELSMYIRESIAKYIENNNFKYICDYGGGFGTLAREIAKKSNNIKIDIYEPFPSEYGKKCIKEFKNIRFINKLKPNEYDCIVSTDVLEHVDDVLSTLKEMLDSLKIGGCALIGNCFYPVIKCHLPKHFHYRYSFKYIAKSMGMNYIDKVSGAEYVEIYSKISDSNITYKTNIIGGGSKIAYKLINIIKPVLKPIYKAIKSILKKGK